MCEDNKKSVYYFTLLPKKNIALVTSSNKEVAKQRLQINRSGANGSYFSTYSTDSKNYQFVLLPDYKALIYKTSEFNFTIEELKEYRSEKNITNSIDSSINAECFNPKSDGSLERPYQKYYGLEHISIDIVKKVYGNASEKKVVQSLWRFQLLFSLMSIIYFTL